MNKYDIFCPVGEKCCGIRIMEKGEETYFAGYDFMGSVNWTKDMNEMIRYNNLRGALQIVKDLESADK